MYREKLIEQLKFLEVRQKNCSQFDIDDVLALSRDILVLAKKIDEYDKQKCVCSPVGTCKDALESELSTNCYAPCKELSYITLSISSAFLDFARTVRS